LATNGASRLERRPRISKTWRERIVIVVCAFEQLLQTFALDAKPLAQLGLNPLLIETR
jgi:hypothetical protein